jgi:hypothetical protein
MRCHWCLLAILTTRVWAWGSKADRWAHGLGAGLALARVGSWSYGGMKVRIGISLGPAEADHFGISLAVAPDGGVPADLAAAIRQRRPGSDPAALVPAGWAAAKRTIEQYVLAGISKFVIRPAAPPASLDDFLGDFARELMPLQT